MTFNCTTVAVAGNPNVGKSVVFNALTGRYAVVSNYPGTTVEVMRGRARVGDADVEVVDTPGMYSLASITEEERVARRMLLGERAAIVLQVADAKTLERGLVLTLELIELGRPVVLVVNMMDEAKALGLQVDTDALGRALGVRAVAAVATKQHGLDAARAVLGDRLRGEVAAPVCTPAFRVDYGELEPAIAEIVAALPAQDAPAARGLAVLLLSGDEELASTLRDRAPEAVALAERLAPPDALLRVAAHRRTAVAAILAGCVRRTSNAGRRLADRLHDLTVQPLTGVPILLAILYFGLYRFVGQFGAGDVVDFLEGTLFEQYVNPWVNQTLATLVPGEGWQHWVRELIGGDYGVITLGVTYAVAIILPLVSLFFLFFSLLEDSGYFPRLALLVDRLFRRIGLNGRAVIPLVLGFGCGTMATMVTRIQETRRERIITTLLLAVAIPCSAQYGVVTGLLAGQPGGPLGVSWAFLAWAGIMLLALVVTGRVASRAVKGESASFYMELPPLRIPRLGNVLVKTFARLRWYFFEILPLFVLVSLFIWLGRLTGLFGMVVRALEPLVGLIGLPPAAAEAFLYGFFRRDFGAAGLYQLQQRGELSGAQLLVACVTLTLFLPCIAQLLVMRRERGLRTAALTAAGVFVGAFLVGGAVNAALEWTGAMR